MSLASAIERSKKMGLAGKNYLNSEPEGPEANAPQPLQGPVPPKVNVTGLPIRGTFNPSQILATDFSKTNEVGAVPLRSSVFPPQPNTGISAPDNLTSQKLSASTSKALVESSAISSKVVAVIDPTTNTLVQTPVSSAPTPSPVAPIRRRPITVDGLTDGTSYARPLSQALTNGNVDPTLPGVLMKGSVPPWINGSFTYTSTTSSITITWSGLTIFKADGTTVNIADGSQTVTSLSANTTYFFYPFYNEASQTFGFVSSEDVANLVDIVGASFDGTSGWISTTGNITRPSSYTCEAWIRPSAAQNRVFLELNLTSGSGGPSATYTASFGLSVASTGLLIFLEAGQAQVAGGNLFDGNYHHVVFTYNGTTVVSYLDGVQLASTALTAPASFTGHWRIGGNAESQAGFYSGQIAHVAVYNSVLTLSQIQVHYQTMVSSGPATYEALPVADSAAHYWTLTETSGTTFVDTIAADNGTLQGGVTLAQSNAILSAAGSPDMAWRNTIPQVSQTQSLQGNVGMSSGGMSAATPASGTGGGSTGGSGSSGTGGLCVTPETQIKTKRGNIPFAELVEGDLVLTAAGTWKKVLRLIRHDYTGPMMIMEQGKITPTHQILALKDWVPSKNVFTRWEAYTGEVLNCEVETQDTDLASSLTEHSYTLACGVVAHNSQTRK